MVFQTISTAFLVIIEFLFANGWFFRAHVLKKRLLFFELTEYIICIPDAPDVFAKSKTIAGIIAKCVETLNVFMVVSRYLLLKTNCNFVATIFNF